ncbi:hypothetical protein K490DRAFT_66385 [Saccharata proteae CBS 121410]|uniref:Metallo-beta-lactamase domain-containing protein n=1 Tax=Saccharata proteae CBS 121410 TaxID=1314787 RepID=A0A9P4HTJ0_9PEZI|nr:hypothetical protein K490DRAFT_66385 [Saccharata proteae CBS 121410]
MSSKDYLKAPVPAPNLHIPASTSTARVSVIDTGARVSLPMTNFLKPDMPGKTRLSGPAYSFLITHPSGRRVLFDLSIRKDIENFPPRIRDRIKDPDWDVKSPQHVADVLTKHGIDLSEVEAIIWSHWHWDHTGSPTTFPPNTSLIVGPGFKENFTPGYPINPDAPLNEADWANRELRELDFGTEGKDLETEGKGLKIGRFQAVDFWGDGSFYLLSSPGHAVGHMCGLARVDSAQGQDSFVFMGGDCCHHPAEFRPTPYLPLPTTITPSPLPKHPKYSRSCPGELFQHLHPTRSADEPFYHVTPSFPHDLNSCNWSIAGCEEFDADPNVLVVMAHDESLLGVMPFFPATLEGWEREGLGVKGRWRFLGDFGEGVRE